MRENLWSIGASTGNRGTVLTPHEQLANAIILQAVRDFRVSYSALKKNPNDLEAQNMLREVRAFFKGGWICVLTKLDGAGLLDSIEREMEQEYEGTVD